MDCLRTFRSPPVAYKANFARLKSFLRSHADPLVIHILYFISISLVGYLFLRFLHLREHPGQDGPRDIDFFFTSVSAATVSSMSTVEMQAFCNAQLIVLTVLMLIGGEVMTSTFGLHFRSKSVDLRRTTSAAQVLPTDVATQIESELSDLSHHIESGTMPDSDGSINIRSVDASADQLRSNALGCLANILKGYLLFIHVAGTIAVTIYICSVSSAREILKQKHITVSTFSVFTTISSFSNCGFIPTNENMMVFKKNTGLLLLIIPQILLGNTLFPPCLRLCIWALRRMRKTKRAQYDYLLKNWKETSFYHLLPYKHSIQLVCTVVGFMAVQLILMCSMEWHSQVLDGMNSYQKLVAALFLSVNSRHAGESVVDLSALSQAVLVLFIIMM